jgi:ABC-2 type transport system ATP-binding protein
LNFAVPVLACRDLRWAYGDRVAVDDISFDVAPGEAFGLLGPNGAGKSTTIKLLCGLLPTVTGEIFIAGHRVEGEAVEARRHLGYVPSEIALYTDLSAAENMEYWGRLFGLRGKQLRTRVAETLEIVSLADRAKDLVREFSSGMQRRLNLAVGLIGNPSLLVLDEPTVGVDAHSRGAILDRLEELRRMGVAILYASHYMEEVERLCTVVGIIDHGKLIAEGTPQELVARLGGAQVVELGANGDLGRFVSEAYTVPGVSEALVVDGMVRLTVDDAASTIPAVMSVASRVGVDLAAIEIRNRNLEAVFLQLTGRTLRD